MAATTFSGRSRCWNCSTACSTKASSSPATSRSPSPTSISSTSACACCSARSRRRSGSGVDKMVYVYAITRAPRDRDPHDLVGIEDAAVEVKIQSSLAAWFSRHSSLPSAADIKHVMSHECVVESLMDHDALLPMRLWTTLRDELELDQLPERHADALSAGLDK